jgi:nitrogen fixation protein
LWRGKDLKNIIIILKFHNYLTGAIELNADWKLSILKGGEEVAVLESPFID